MAKSIKPAPKNQVKTIRHFRVDVFLIEIFGRFGITGSCILTAIYIFLQFGTIEQKREFIDSFILLKIAKSDNKIAIFIVIILVILFLFQNVFFRKKNKLKEQRIFELERQLKFLEKKIK